MLSQLTTLCAAVMWLAVIAVLFLTCLWLILRWPKHPVDQLPGPPTIRFFGNVLMFTKPKHEVFAKFNEIGRTYRSIYRTWQTKFIPVIHPLDPKYVETILTSSEHITKSPDYDFLNDWLGTGLLISTGSKWHSRRKLLTPAFHFSILEQFVPVFSDKTRVLVSKLRETRGQKVDITPLVTRCALDIICQTAMGHAVNAQENANSPYVAAVYGISDLIVHRLLRPWLHPTWIYNLSPTGRKQAKLLSILHGFTKKVIRERREEFRKIKLENEKSGNIGEDIYFGGGKRKTAFLDLLLAASEQDGGLTDEDIREEVDTFMFEGHDTTAMAMSWALYFISAHPKVQARCVSELIEIFGDSKRDPSLSDLNSMKYLERVIKETLRLRPSVITIARRLTQNLKLEGFEEFPPDTNIHVNIYNVHRNPDIYPDPEKFDPDRFLTENCVGRHPYAYIPFSAGPRNCIGQKFAMLEMKSLLSTVVRHFRFESVDPEVCYEAVPDLILRPRFGLITRFYPRDT